MVRSTLLFAAVSAFGQPAASGDSLAKIWGAVYVPAGAYNAPQMWKSFSAAETRRDFGYAQKLHLKALRVWASYEYWQAEPERFEAAFDQLLDAAKEADIRILISLFESNGVKPTPENMWTADPEKAFCIISPDSEIVSPNHRERWEAPRGFVKWFMGKYRDDQRLIAIEVFNEPRNQIIPFAKSMLQTAKSMKGSVPLTIGAETIASAREFIPDGSDILEFHANFPRSTAAFESEIKNAVAVGEQYHLPIWLTEWQRVRPSGPGWKNEEITDEEKLSNYASLADSVRKYPIGSFFWSLMVKPAYLPSQRHVGTVNGVFHPDGTVASLRDARALANDPSLTLAENPASLPPNR